MRNINFIKPISTHQRNELRRWALGSGLLIMSIITSCSIISITQWRIYYVLNLQKKALSLQLASYDQVINKQHDQTKQHNALQQKLAQLQVYANKPKNPIDIITTVQKILGTMPLESLSVDAHHFELKGRCNSPKHATNLVAKLNELPLCKNAQLYSLSTATNNSLEFAIKGTIV